MWLFQTCMSKIFFKGMDDASEVNFCAPAGECKCMFSLYFAKYVELRHGRNCAHFIAKSCPIAWVAELHKI